mgnify:CR=1 FL=1
MLIPKITPYDTKIIPQMYKDGYILTAIYDNKIFWHKNEQVQYEEENQDKKAMYEKMAELKRDPLEYKKLEEQAFLQLSKKQQDSDAMKFHRDTKLRQMIMEMIQE